MFNMEQAIQTIITRILSGNTVPVKREFEKMMRNSLTNEGIAFIVEEDKTNTSKVLFSLATVGDGG